MIVVGMEGEQGAGKNALADGLKLVVPRSIITESSAVISTVANRMNPSLRVYGPARLTEDHKALKHWSDGNLAASIQAATPLSFDARKLRFEIDDIERRPDLYEPLFRYLKLVEAQPHLLRERITPDNKDTHRAILQWFGGYVNIKLDRSLWYNELGRQAVLAADGGIQLFAACGVRFGNDEMELRKLPDRNPDIKPFIFKVVRPGTDKSRNNTLTERSRSEINHDTVVYNNGSLDDLNLLALDMVQDMASGHLKAKYFAMDM